MADKEHLKILRQGVEAWNQWRDDNPEIRPDLSDDRFFHDPYFIPQKLLKANFTNTNLSNIDLTDCIFDKADLRGANLSGVKCNYTSFRNSDFRGANLTKAQLGYDIDGYPIDSPDEEPYVGCSVIDLNLSETNLHGAYLGALDLTQVNFKGANLNEVDFSQSNLSGVDLSYHNLIGAKLHGTKLKQN